MEVIRGTGVNELYAMGMDLLLRNGLKEGSRNGPVTVMPCPVTSVYANPRERVLLDPRRNANPFFHLYESLWMLAGRDDVKALDVYISDFSQRFAEPNGRVHGAYGFRWRWALGFDQLAAIVSRLRANQQDRQCVLQMWDARTNNRVGYEKQGADDGENDLLGNWKDRPCNTHVYFRVRLEEPEEKDAAAGAEPYPVLDMTVCCRSNDIIYGAYGANAVHFSILMEYVAGMIGVPVGTMYQISNNYHAYDNVVEKVGRPTVRTYYALGISPSPIVEIPDEWDNDLKRLMSWSDKSNPAVRVVFSNSWFENTVVPMLSSYWLWKRSKRDEAMVLANSIVAEDWRMAVLDWFDRRKK